MFGGQCNMNKKKRRNIVFVNALLTGFFGGILLASVYLSFRYFNMSKVSHTQILEFFYINGEWLNKWFGYVLFIFVIGFISLIFALIYYLLFRRIKGWFFGAFFGICLWVIFGLLIPLFVYDVKFMTFYKSYTNVLNICAFFLYGIFIGYSISYDEETSRLTMDHQ